MKERISVPVPAVGANSLLVIFAVLCLTVFTLLSIATVQADRRLGDRAEAAVAGYYQADCQAEAILAQLRAGEIPPNVTYQDGVYAYFCPISQTQALAVRVRITSTAYTVLQWQAISTSQWEADNRLPVWNGQTN